MLIHSVYVYPYSRGTRDRHDAISQIFTLTTKWECWFIIASNNSKGHAYEKSYKKTSPYSAARRAEQRSVHRSHPCVYRLIRLFLINSIRWIQMIFLIVFEKDCMCSCAEQIISPLNPKICCCYNVNGPFVDSIWMVRNVYG